MEVEAGREWEFTSTQATLRAHWIYVQWHEGGASDGDRAFRAAWLGGSASAAVRVRCTLHVTFFCMATSPRTDEVASTETEVPRHHGLKEVDQAPESEGRRTPSAT